MKDIMKRIFLFLIGIVLLLPLEAQDTSYKIYPNAPSVFARFSIITPQFVVEFAPVDHFTFTTGLWIRPSFRSPDENGDMYFHGIPTLEPRITLEPRYFFTLEYRDRRGKRTDYYSGWYVGIPFALEFRSLKYSLGASMGFQCTFGRRWYWNIGMGPGITYEETRFRVSAVGGVGFGIIFN